MPINTNCPHCGKTDRVKDELAGRAMRCAGCGRSFTLAALITRPPPPPPPFRPDRDWEDDRPPLRASGAPLGVVIGVAAGGLVLVAGLLLGGYLAFRGLSGAPVGGPVAAPAPQGGGTSTGKVADGDPPADAGKPPAVALVKPTVFDVGGSEFALNNIVVPAAGKEVVAITGSLLPGANPKPTALRFDLATGRPAGRQDLDLPSPWGIHSVSPDGSVLALNKSAASDGVEVALIKLADGATINPGWRPTHAAGAATYRARHAFALDATRWLAVYENGAIDLWTLTADGAQRRPLREGGAAKVESRTTAAISRDRRTLALWTGLGFTWLDAATGAERGKAAPIDAPPQGERLECWHAHFSPDGTSLLAELANWRDRRFTQSFARWEVRPGGAATRFTGVGSSATSRWWGNRHIVTSGGAREMNVFGHVTDVTTGKALCKLGWQGSMVNALAEDGHLWYRSSRKPFGQDAVLVRMPFPGAAVRPLAGRDEGPFDQLPLMELTLDGVKVR